MDLRLTTETARNAVIWILNCIGVVLLLWITSIYGNDGPGEQDFSASVLENPSHGRVIPADP